MKNVIFLVLVCIFTDTYGQPAQNATTAVFPTFTDSIYIVTPGDAQIDGDVLYIPKGHTIRFSPVVNQVNWKFNTLIFEENATIDLSHRDISFPPMLLAPAPNNSVCNPRECPNDGTTTTLVGCTGGFYGNSGPKGIDGLNGINGIDGTNLILKVNHINNNGSLWIRTDGSDGTAGQKGGDGGYGASGKCGGPLGHGTNGGNGGDGGYGGIGGKGGNTGRVLFINFADQIIQTAVFSAETTPSLRPGQVTGNTGLIAIYGNPGKGGEGNFGGRGGERGHGCNCGVGPFNTSHSNDGKDGTSFNNVKSPGGVDGVFIL